MKVRIGEKKVDRKSRRFVRKIHTQIRKHNKLAINHFINRWIKGELRLETFRTFLSADISINKASFNIYIYFFDRVDLVTFYFYT